MFQQQRCVWVSSQLKKKLPNAIDEPLVLILNCCFQSGIFPTSKKTTKTIPIYKKGDKTLPSDYGAISIIPGFGIFFEKAIHNQLCNLEVIHQTPAENISCDDFRCSNV
jgi:hypothetical protein